MDRVAFLVQAEWAASQDQVVVPVATRVVLAGQAQTVAAREPVAGGVSGSTGGAGGGGTGGATGWGGGGGGAITICGTLTNSLGSHPADLLLVLDRSGSMALNSLDMSCVGGCGDASKWSQMTAAINQVVAMTESTVNWGLKFFANDSLCGVTAGVAVAPAPNNANAIAAAIAATIPAGSTPTTAAELGAGQYLGTLTDGNPKFILLATDGLPNCGLGSSTTADDVRAIQAAGSVRAMGFDTFVIGIATIGTIADSSLSMMAVNGGRGRGATPEYFPVSNTAELVSVLDSIQGMVTMTCTFPLTNVPPSADRNNVDVSASGGTVSINPDPGNGWSYGAGMTSIILNGSACSEYTGGIFTDLRITFGCI